MTIFINLYFRLHYATIIMINETILITNKINSLMISIFVSSYIRFNSTNLDKSLKII